MATLFGKTMVNATELAVVKGTLDTLLSENQTLGGIIIKQDGVINSLMAIVQRIDASFTTVIDHVTDIKERAENIEAVVFEQVTTNHIGKKPVLLEQVQKETEKLTVKEIRALINRAANRQQKGYNVLYAKLHELTGVDVYEIGKTVITKVDALGFVNPQETYINTVFKKGVQFEAAAIALDMIRNK